MSSCRVRSSEALFSCRVRSSEAFVQLPQAQANHYELPDPNPDLGPRDDDCMFHTLLVPDGPACCYSPRRGPDLGGRGGARDIPQFNTQI